MTEQELAKIFGSTQLSAADAGKISSIIAVMNQLNQRFLSSETERQESTPTKAETKPAEPKPQQRAENEDEEFTTDDGSIFGSPESADREFLEAFADFVIAKPNEEEMKKESEDTRRPKLVDFVDDSDEALERAIAKWNKATKKLSANVVFDPDL